MASPTGPMRGGRAAELAVLLILAFGVWLGFATAGLPRVVSLSAPATSFSAERAQRDLATIAAAPHPVGSAAHDRLRDYLVDRLRALGLIDVHIQSATGFNTLNGPLAATVANVVGRKRGTHPGPALLLTAHYDAVPRSFGAGDDGAGVAAIIETLRALAAGPPLNNDLIVVFNDAEEEGLLGAEAFVDLHPWAKDVGAVLNLDARGDTGPVFMFQTSPGNATLIGALAAGVPDARTNSLTGEVYRHLPSDTDMSIWLHSAFNVGALNFANVAGYQRYHTPMDNLAFLDLRVVQQMGDNLLGLTRTLGNRGLARMRTTDAVYFSAPAVGMIHYPVSLAIPVSVVGLIGVLVLAGVAVRHRALNGTGVGRGLVLLLVTVAVPTVAAWLAWRLIRRVHPAYADILQGDPYNSLWYLLAFSAGTIAIGLTVQRRLSASATALELSIAPLLLWSALGIAAAVMLPGASYLLAWPLVAATIGAVWWLADAQSHRAPHPAIALLAIPALVLWPPLVMSLEIALTANLLPLCALLTALTLSLLVIPIDLTGRAQRWITPTVALVSIAALVQAEVTAGFNATRKHPDSLAYLTDADTHQAWWVSFDRAPDVWTARVLGARPPRRVFDDFRLAGPGVAVLAVDASPPVAEAPPVRIIEQHDAIGGRRLHLHVDRSGDGEAVSLFLDGIGVASNVTIDGRVLRDSTGSRYSPTYHMGSDGAILRYFGVPDDGVDLWFTITAPGATRLRVMTATEGVPATAIGPLPPRPANLMSKPFVLTDMTIVTRLIPP
ncbi:MAG: M20/M25/M40 family metallo-hydrolase [Gemmatimonadales bacterium]